MLCVISVLLNLLRFVFFFFFGSESLQIYLNKCSLHSGKQCASCCCWVERWKCQLTLTSRGVSSACSTDSRGGCWTLQLSFWVFLFFQFLQVLALWLGAYTFRIFMCFWWINLFILWNEPLYLWKYSLLWSPFRLTVLWSFQLTFQ